MRPPLGGLATESAPSSMPRLTAENASSGTVNISPEYMMSLVTGCIPARLPVLTSVEVDPKISGEIPDFGCQMFAVQVQLLREWR